MANTHMGLSVTTTVYRLWTKPWEGVHNLIQQREDDFGGSHVWMGQTDTCQGPSVVKITNDVKAIRIFQAVWQPAFLHDPRGREPEK